MRHYIRIGILSFPTTLITPSILNDLMKLFLIFKKNSNKEAETLDDWFCSLNNIPKICCRGAKQQIKNQSKKREFKYTCAAIYCYYSFSSNSKNISLSLCGSNEHLQDTLLNKLTDHFNIVNNTQVFQRPKHLTWDCSFLQKVFICNKEGQYTLSTSCNQVHELPQSSCFGDNQESTLFS